MRRMINIDELGEIIEYNKKYLEWEIKNDIIVANSDRYTIILKRKKLDVQMYGTYTFSAIIKDLDGYEIKVDKRGKTSVKIIFDKIQDEYMNKKSEEFKKYMGLYNRKIKLNSYD